MERFCNCFKPFQMEGQGRGMIFLLCLFIAGNGLAQTPGASPGKPPQNPLSVTLEVMCNGDALHAGDTLHAPAGIFILAGVTTKVGAHAGDTVTIDLFANNNKLGSRKSVWHDAIKPDPHSRKFQPMIMVAPGFGWVDFTWSNAPAGSYALTARASGLHGLSVVSAPVNITIVTSVPP